MEVESAVQALPDELLLEIFGQIDDADTLLDGLALVCRRWNALAREPRAWAGVRLSWRSAKSAGGLNRVLLRAPALRSLEMRALEPHLSALARSRAEVTGRLSLPLYHDLHKAGHVAALLNLLWRSRDHLRQLDLGLRGPHLCLGAAHNEGRALAQVLASVRELRRLQLYLDCAGSTPGCAEDPATSSLRLQHLQLEGLRPSPPTCVLQLLRGTAASLRSLRVELPQRPCVELEAWLGLCVGLRSATFNRLPPLSALSSWTQLERLEITALKVCADGQLEPFGRSLLTCAAMKSLLSLEVNIPLLVDGGFDSPPLAQCRQHVANFKQSRPDVDVRVFTAKGLRMRTRWM